jgi:GcrA cell cycle regulator
MSGPHRWTSDAIAKARVLWREGQSAREIGVVFGVSKGSVLGVADRNGFTSRKPDHPRRAYDPQDRRGRADRHHPPKPVVVLVPVAAGLPVRVLRLSPVAACCWPLGEPRTPAFRWCGAAAVVGRSYCPAHVALAYRPARELLHVG